MLHLDHGQDIEFVQQAIELGFNSVMIDASLEDFDENVRKTNSVLAYAKPRKIAVEAEIGFVGANDNLENHEVIQSVYTTVDQAINFVQATNVDTLAISIGTAHGIYKGTPSINFERLQQIRKAIKTPLVLHGGSSSGDENLNRCAINGITKINLFSDLIQAGYTGHLASSSFNYPSLTTNIKQKMSDMLAHYYSVFETKTHGGIDNEFI